MTRQRLAFGLASCLLASLPAPAVHAVEYANREKNGARDGG